MVNYSRFIGRAMVLMYKPSMIDSAPTKRRKRPLDGISGVQKVAAVEKWFRCSPGCFWGIIVYIGGRSRSGGQRGAHKVGGRTLPPWARPPPLWPPRGSSNFHSKSPGCLLVQEKSSRKFYSVWTPFGIPFLQNSKTRKKQKLALGSRLIG